MPTPDLLTVPEAAEALNVKERFVRRLIAERRITFVHVGKFVRIPRQVVVDFIDAGTVAPIVVRAGRAA